MIIKLKLKEIREQKEISIRKLAEDTGIQRERLADIENEQINVDNILFVEMIVLAENLACSILDLYEVEHLEIKGIGEV